MDGMDIGVLTRLAEDMLTSPDKAVRDAAAFRLRVMSYYDNWESLKWLLTQCSNNYLHFLIAKAMLFIVSNELGPQERRDTQELVLSHLKSVVDRGTVPPKYVRNVLYAVYAAALYINWRMVVISFDEDPKSFARRIIEELRPRFPVEILLEFVLGVLNYFVQQMSRGAMNHTRVAFVQGILPTFFQLGVEHIQTNGELALEISCIVLEGIPPSPNESLITVRLTTCDSVFLDNGCGWFPALTIAVQECGRTLLEDHTTHLSELCARFLRNASSVVCLDAGWFSARTALSDTLLMLSGELLEVFMSTGYTHLLRLACALLVNVFDRDEGKVTAYMFNRPQLVEAWAQAAQGLLDKWDENEADLRKELMHLFFLFGDRVIPRGSSSECNNSRSSPIASTVLRVGQCYFSNVVNKAHLNEDCSELRSDVGVMLRNEKTLLPIAEMLFCEHIDLYSFISERLRTTVQQYEMCIRARESADSEELGKMMLSFAIDTDSICPSLGASDVPLFLQHVCLSRLSVIISLVAVAVLNDTAHNGSDIIDTVGSFAKSVMNTEDSVTAALLESFSLFDLGGNDLDDVFGGTRRDSNCNHNGGANRNERRVHVGILRALFFFCGCVYESQLEGCAEFYEVMMALLQYVYTHHSTQIPLVVDANGILIKVLAHSVRCCFLSSDKMSCILAAANEERIELLNFSGGTLSKEARRARSGTLTALTYFVESRHYAGYPTLDLLPSLIARILDPARLVTEPDEHVSDLIAISEGIHQRESLFWLLDAIVTECNLLEDVMCSVPSVIPLMVKLCARLSDLSTQLLLEDNRCETCFGLLTFTLLAVSAVVDPYCVPGDTEQATRYTFPTDAVDVQVVYNIALITYNLITGDWCNLGVVLAYDNSFLHVFNGFLSLVSSTSVEVLMSSCNLREKVFQTITVALSSASNFSQQICEIIHSCGLWDVLLSSLAKCLRHTFLTDVLTAIETVLVSVGCNGEPLLCVSDYVVGDIFHEVVVYVAGCPLLDKREGEQCFRMLLKCFRLAQSVCSLRMDTLLDLCSAYHRVRVRHIYTLLRGDCSDLFYSYTTVFGCSSKVQTLSAW
ncbi:hypothetical protein TRVL_03831 [Trypanosoma vivax]|nr:hypothetical protein TRVL_03831 [Trypanosoma vivax]